MSGFERKTLNDGSANPKYIDLCDEDPLISGQKFACMSFVSPEKILKQRELFIFEKFITEWDFTKSMMKMSDFVNFLSYKYNLKVDDVMKDFQEYVKEEHDNLRDASLDDDWKTFMDKNETKLNEEFNRKHEFQTSVRGLKLRGVFNTQEEAELRCKKIRDFDPNHDIFVGPVGMWIPWDPDAYKTGRIEFMEDELNQLHNEKSVNESRAKEEFDKRVKDAKRTAIEENIKKAKESGNVLTQSLNEDGDLVGVSETVNFDEREDVDATSVSVRNELVRDNAVGGGD
tara:strand:+ start:3543 stop:4400 length:858 start_codon:yes stop_codon:yes gene_type:complete